MIHCYSTLILNHAHFQLTNKLQTLGSAQIATTHTMSCWIASSISFSRRIPTWRLAVSQSSSCDRLRCFVSAQKRLRSRTSTKSARHCIGSRNICSISCWLSWVRVDRSMEIRSLSSREDSSRSKLRMCWEGLYQSDKSRIFIWWSWLTIFIHNTLQIHQRIRHLPHLPFARDHSAERYTSLLPPVWIVRLTLLRCIDQIRFPGCHWQACCNACKDRLKVSSPVYYGVNCYIGFILWTN